MQTFQQSNCYPTTGLAVKFKLKYAGVVVIGLWDWWKYGFLTQCYSLEISRAVFSNIAATICD